MLSLCQQVSGADGWVRQRTSADPSPISRENNQNHLFPSPPLRQLAVDFFTARNASPLAQDVAEEHVRGFVGYSIPSRRIVLGLLAGFVIVLGGLGHWSSRSGRLGRGD